MIETIGSVAKEELLKTVDHYILPNSFVMQNLEPYPGYHGLNLPIDQAPDTFFFVTLEEHSPEKVFRIAHNIRSFTEYSFDACPAKLCIGNDTYHSIRVRDLNSYEPVEEIQKCFLDTGIQFMKKKDVEATTLIELRKIFKLEEVNENILKDTNGLMHYLKVRKQLTWGRFKKISLWVKNNLYDSNFDAALAVVYGADVYDLVRIYMPEPKPERLEEIRQKYLEGIQRTEK
jgi:hypothetical protein